MHALGVGGRYHINIKMYFNNNTRNTNNTNNNNNKIILIEIETGGGGAPGSGHPSGYVL